MDTSCLLTFNPLLISLSNWEVSTVVSLSKSFMFVCKHHLLRCNHLSFSLPKKTQITGSSAVYVHLVPACSWKSSTSRKINSPCCPAFNARMLNEVINTVPWVIILWGIETSHLILQWWFTGGRGCLSVDSNCVREYVPAHQGRSALINAGKVKQSIYKTNV